MHGQVENKGDFTILTWHEGLERKTQKDTVYTLSLNQVTWSLQTFVPYRCGFHCKNMEVDVTLKWVAAQLPSDCCNISLV